MQILKAMFKFNVCINKQANKGLTAASEKYSIQGAPN